MLINFLNPHLKPIIKCSAIAEDFYPIENLISTNSAALQRGFMAYSVTKPPVNLHIELLCPIEIYSIKIETKIGSLVTTAIDIHHRDNGNLIKIGSCGNIDDGVIFLSNETHHPNTDKEIDISNRNAQNLIKSRMFRMRRRKTMQNILIELKKSAKCAPVIKRLEIWGRPTERIAEIENLWLQRNANNSEYLIKTDSETKQSTSINSHSNLIVPDEFLDALTYEIMTLPMVLPSGKIIDRQTLDRCTKVEECWGRMPADPFTGLCFTSTKKPIFDASLKSRIDAFLMRHQNHSEIIHIPRTIGIKRTHSNDQIDSQTIKRSLGTIKHCGSMEKAISSALETITRFSSTSKPSSTVNLCFKCHKTNDNLYKIAICSHFICRLCLMMIDRHGNLCTICQRSFDKNQVHRVHR